MKFFEANILNCAYVFKITEISMYILQYILELRNNGQFLSILRDGKALEFYDIISVLR